MASDKSWDDMSKLLNKFYQMPDAGKKSSFTQNPLGWQDSRGERTVQAFSRLFTDSQIFRSRPSEPFRAEVDWKSLGTYRVTQHSFDQRITIMGS
jgi:1,4-alpha-glucan branching enzyme